MICSQLLQNKSSTFNHQPCSQCRNLKHQLWQVFPQCSPCFRIIPVLLPCDLPLNGQIWMTNGMDWVSLAAAFIMEPMELRNKNHTRLAARDDDEHALTLLQSQSRTLAQCLAKLSSVQIKRVCMNLNGSRWTTLVVFRFIFVIHHLLLLLLLLLLIIIIIIIISCCCCCSFALCCFVWRATTSGLLASKITACSCSQRVLRITLEQTTTGNRNRQNRFSRKLKIELELPEPWNRNRKRDRARLRPSVPTQERRRKKTFPQRNHWNYKPEQRKQFQALTSTEPNQGHPALLNTPLLGVVIEYPHFCGPNPQE